MYYFVEYLRAMRALKIVGIILGILVLVGIIFRLSFLHGASPLAFTTTLQSSPTAHVTKETLPDGSTRVTVDDPVKHTHAVILRSGTTVTVDATEPARAGRHGQDSVVFGSMNRSESTRNGVTHVAFTYKPGADFTWGGLFQFSILMGVIVASILAGPLAKENDGHLELAWTKPVSRERYAFAAIVTDIVTMIVSQLATIAVILLCTIMWVVPSLTAGRNAAELILFALVAPIAWYACLTCFSASLRRGPGMVIGLGWFVALVIPTVYGVTMGSYNPVIIGVHAIFTALAYIDPIVYVPSMTPHGARAALFASTSLCLLAVALLSIAYITVAVLQWRRVEA